MAFVQQEDEQNKQQAPGQPQVPTTSSAPGAGPASSTGKSAPQSTPAQPFQNLQAYLSANQPQVTQQANKIAGDLTNQYGQVQADINNAKTDFQGQVQAGYAQPNDQVVTSAASDPSAFVSNPQNVKAFQSLYNDAYTGPQNFESTNAYQNLSQEAMKAANEAAQINTPGGIKTYFQNQNPNATAGGNTLDSVLLQGSPEAITQVQNAAKPFTTLNDYLNQTVTEGNNAVTNAQNQAKSISQGVQDKFVGPNGVITSAKNDLQSRVQAARDAATKQAASERQLLTPAPGTTLPAQLTPQQLNDLGMKWNDYAKFLDNDLLLTNRLSKPLGMTINGATWTPYQGNFSPANYLTTQDAETAITPEKFANKDDYAKFAALQELTGQDLTGTLNSANAEQAGTAPTNLNSFDPAALTDAQNLTNQYSRSLENYIQMLAPPAQQLGPDATDEQIRDWLIQNKVIASGQSNPTAGFGGGVDSGIV